jgi:hypothetical protein
VKAAKEAKIRALETERVAIWSRMMSSEPSIVVSSSGTLSRRVDLLGDNFTIFFLVENTQPRAA